MCRVLHMVCILLVWSLAHYIIYIHAENESFNIVQFFSKLYDSNWNYSYWYLYAYIGFLLSLLYIPLSVSTLHGHLVHGFRPLSASIPVC